MFPFDDITGAGTASTDFSDMSNVSVNVGVSTHTLNDSIMTILNVCGPGAFSSSRSYTCPIRQFDGGPDLHQICPGDSRMPKTIRGGGRSSDLPSHQICPDPGAHRVSNQVYLSL